MWILEYSIQYLWGKVGVQPKKRLDVWCQDALSCRGHPARCGNGDWITPISCMIKTVSQFWKKEYPSLNPCCCNDCRRRRQVHVVGSVGGRNFVSSNMPSSRATMRSTRAVVWSPDNWVSAACSDDAATNDSMCATALHDDDHHRDGAIAPKKKMTFLVLNYIKRHGGTTNPPPRIYTCTRVHVYWMQYDVWPSFTGYSCSFKNLLHFKVYRIFFLLAWLGEKYSNFLLLFRRTIPRRDKMVRVLLNGKSAKYNFSRSNFWNHL